MFKRLRHGCTNIGFVHHRCSYVFVGIGRRRCERFHLDSFDWRGEVTGLEWVHFDCDRNDHVDFNDHDRATTA
jgi:hypothetical protein